MTIKEKIQEAFNKLQKLPKPNAYKYGNNYYGSTELITHVGNMLELITTPYRSYSYGLTRFFDNPFAIKVGSAYEGKEVSEIINNLEKDLKEACFKKREIKSVILDYGTNFCVLGIGEE